MFQTLIVYISLAIAMILLCRYYAKFPYGKNSYLNWVLILYSIIFGFRYGVGVDYFSYKEIYEYLSKRGELIYIGIEPGFLFLMELCGNLGTNYVFFFTLLAFLQIYFLFKAFRNEKFIMPYLAYTLMASCIWLTFSNTIRQNLAFCIFVYSLPFILKRNWKAYYIFCLLAFSFHKSAALLFLLYPLFVWKKEWINNVKLQLILYAISIILMNINIIPNILSLIEGFILSTPYAGYIDTDSEDKLSSISSEVSLGIGYYVITLTAILQMIYSKRIKEIFPNSIYTLTYNLFFIGALWRNIFVSSLIFNRVNYYLFGFSFIIGAYTLFYLYRKNIRMFYFLAFLYFLIFVGNMSNMDSNTSKYYFFWQEDSYVMPIRE